MHGIKACIYDKELPRQEIDEVEKFSKAISK